MAVPNSFSPNTQIKSAQVNANFTHITDMIDENGSGQVVLGTNSLRPTRFVPVSDPSAWHYDSGVTAALTSYTDVDVSSVVSARAFAIAYRGYFRAHSTRILYVRQNGEGTDTYDANQHLAPVDQVDSGFTGIVELDSSKVFEFKQNTAGGLNNNCQYAFQVVGYFEYID